MFIYLTEPNEKSGITEFIKKSHLCEIDQKFKIFRGSMIVVDIGAAPGSWSQYADKVAKNGKLISIDLKKMEPIGSSCLLYTSPSPRDRG